VIPADVRTDVTTELEIATAQGPAKVYLHAGEEPVGALMLGHGAGGGVTAPDLVAVTDAARSVGFSVALVEQPYRVAGRRSSPRADRLDEAWRAVVEHLRATELSDLPIVVGGRSAGARVACRTAADSAAVAVLCLAFPLRTPRRSPTAAPTSRQAELDAVDVPMLVVQGASDPFGVPAPGGAREVVTVQGNHSLKTDLPAVAEAVRGWLPRVVSRS
jgi:uncharacterized protein